MIVIGGSAGSLEIVLAVLSQLLGSGFPPLLIVLHRKVANDSLLAELLASKTHLTVKEAEEKEMIRMDTVYLAPADYHVLIEHDLSFSLDYSEKVHYSRPSIDVVFESAALAFGSGLTCILLSGANTDGAEGCRFAKARGATVLVQDPATASVPVMPQAVLDLNSADHVMSANELAAWINRQKIV